MSLFAGIYSIKEVGNGVSPRCEACRSIVRLISRANDHVEVYSGSRFFLAKVDIGAFPERAFWRSDGNSGGNMVAALAGHPYLSTSKQSQRSRSQELKEICRSAYDGDGSIFRQCDGSFAFCSYDESKGSLILATDRLGVRPLYYYMDEDHLYFATSLRVLRSLSVVKTVMDVEAVVQTAVLGYALGDHTPFSDIKILEDGQLLQATGGHIHLVQYSRLDSIRPFPDAAEDLHKVMYETFTTAVRLRSSQTNTAFSLLSGGLDSRCIVTSLTQLGKKVGTLTFSPACKSGGDIQQWRFLVTEPLRLCHGL